MTITARAVGAVLLVAAFLTGCRTVNVGGDYAFDPGKTTGLAVVSLTMAGLPSRYNMFVDFRGGSLKLPSSVAVHDVFASADWRCPFFGTATEEEPCGRLAVIELPAGQYEFYSWHGSSGQGSNVGAVQSFSKPFSVVAGKAVYLGNLHFSVESPRFMIGTGSFRLRVVDRQARDLPLLRAKNPGLTADRLVIAVMPD